MNVAGYSSTRFSTTSGDIIGAEQLKAVSPVAWIHVNFYGRYSFSEEPLDVPIYGFVETMAKCSFRTEISTSEETIDRSVTVKRTSVRYKFSGRAGLNPNNLSTSVSHTLEIRVLGTKNSSATGTRVDIDEFTVLR